MNEYQKPRSMAKGLSLTAVLVAVLAATSPSTMAQSPAGSFQLGSGYVYPEIEFAVQRDSNIALQPNGVGDTIMYVRPSLRLDARAGPHSYDTGYKGEYASYNNKTILNYDNHEVFAGGDWTLDARNNVRLRGQFLDKVDPSGILPLQNITTSPNEYHQAILTGLYTYGAQEAAGKLELQAGGYSKNYVNNPLQTDALDHSRTELGATLLLRIQPKTYATIAAREYRFKYEQAGSAKDSQEIFVLAGLRWNITTLTSGRINVGRETKNFDSTKTADFSGVAWEGGLNWRPLFNSSFDFVTQKGTQESTGVGDFVLNETSQIVWTHVWGSRVTSILTAANLKDSYSGTSRQDTSWIGGIRVLYSVKRWLKFGAEQTNSMRDSNDNQFDYRRSQSMLLVNITL